MPTGPECDRHLNRVVLFADLTEAEREQLLEQHRVLSFAADQVLLLEQDASQGLLLIRAGLAKVRSFGVGGDEVVLSLLGPGDICGEMAVLHGGRRIADVVTLTPCEVLILRAGPFRRLLDASPALCLALARLEVQRLQSLSRRLTLRTADATTRLLAVLLDLARHGAPGADATASIPPLPQRELALLAGLARETASRTLGKLRSQGIVEDLDGGGLRIVDLDPLRRRGLLL